MTEEQEAPRGGCISTGLMMFAGLGGLITLISAINVAFDLELVLKVYGSRTELPTDWMAVIALAIICAIAFGIATIMTNAWVGRQFKKRPWLKWATPVLITLGLSIGFYAVYYNIEYAGPLHYATRDNDIETVKEELEGEVNDKDYRHAMDECIELDRLDIMKLLLEHPYAETNMKGDFNYALEIGSPEIIIAFINAGIGTEGESGDYLAHFLAVSDLSKADKEEVGLALFESGTNPNGIYTGGYKGTDLSALEQAREQGLTKLVNAMEAN